MSGWGRRFAEKVSQTLAQVVANGQQASDRLAEALDSLSEPDPDAQRVPVRVRVPSKQRNPDRR